MIKEKIIPAFFSAICGGFLGAFPGMIFMCGVSEVSKKHENIWHFLIFVILSAIIFFIATIIQINKEKKYEQNLKRRFPKSYDILSEFWCWNLEKYDFTSFSIRRDQHILKFFINNLVYSYDKEKDKIFINKGLIDVFNSHEVDIIFKFFDSEIFKTISALEEAKKEAERQKFNEDIKILSKIIEDFEE